MQYKIMLIEHNRLLLEQLSKVIENAPDMELEARFQSSSDALGQGRVFNPNIILLDAEIGNATELLQELIGVFPGAAVICTGEKWEAESTSHFIQAGASGYLIKPFTYNGLKEAIKIYTANGMEMDCHAMTFFSPKGKSGKTTLIANLAMAISRTTGEQVGIIDADLQFGDMAVFFNLEPQSTIVEAARDARFLSPLDLRSYYTKVNDKVSVLCGTKTPSLIDRVAIDSLEAVIKMSRSLFKYLLIDVPAGFNPTSIAAAEMSDTTYVVAMMNGGYEVKHVQRALEIFTGWEDYASRVKTVFTRVVPCNDQSRRKMTEAMGYPVEAVMPNAYMVVSKAADNGQMALDLEPDSPLAMSINYLAGRIIHPPAGGTGDD